MLLILEFSLSNEISNWLSVFHELNPETVEDTEQEKEKYLNDMFKEVLPALDCCNKEFYNARTEEQKKELQEGMWKIMRLMSSSNNYPEHHIRMVNDLVNCDFNILVKKASLGREGHPGLQWKLLALCGSGESQYHVMIKPPKGARKNKVEEAILNHFPLLRTDELELLIKINSKEDLIQFFKENGYDDKEIDNILVKGKESLIIKWNKILNVDSVEKNSTERRPYQLICALRKDGIWT